MAKNLKDELQLAFKGGLYDAHDASWHGDYCPTGILAIDKACGGGFGFGRLAELFGDWSTGKTLVLYQTLINNQLSGGTSILFEAEGAFDPEWYVALGGIFGENEPNSLLLKPIDTIEEFFEGVHKIADVIEKRNDPNVKVVVGWDSIAATGTKKLQKEGLEGKRDMTKPFLMDQGTKRIVNAIKRSRIAVIATNQSRVKIGAPDWAETHTPGGRAYPYMCSTRIELKYDGGPAGSKILTEDQKPQKIGRYVKGEVVKNKLGPPFRTFKLALYTEAGHPHPIFKGTRNTLLGIDKDEALLDYYLSNVKAYDRESGDRYVTGGAGGRYKLHVGIDPDQKSFTKKQWPEILLSFPQLREMDPIAKKQRKRKKR